LTIVASLAVLVCHSQNECCVFFKCYGKNFLKTTKLMEKLTTLSGQCSLNLIPLHTHTVFKPFILGKMLVNHNSSWNLKWKAAPKLSILLISSEMVERGGKLSCITNLLLFVVQRNWVTIYTEGVDFQSLVWYYTMN